MESTHEIIIGDARDMSSLEDNSVELVVTSPPYPMIEMWDELFNSLNNNISESLENGDGSEAFELMHLELDKVWEELERVVVEGGIICVNIGDATRSIGGSFELFSNSARIIECFQGLGLDVLPEIHWRKTTNKATKFMGSGMIPPNQYVTLEHEKVLLFRNGSSRVFESGCERRYESAYFREERNKWFTDEWDSISGVSQDLPDGMGRDRSAAFSLEVPYRLVNMFSVYGDTVLDPFWGTGTTSIAAAVSGRNSIGFELDEGFKEYFSKVMKGRLHMIARRRVSERVQEHREHVSEMNCNYDAENYDFGVMTKQEREVQFYLPVDIRETNTGFEVEYEEYDTSR